MRDKVYQKDTAYRPAYHLYAEKNLQYYQQGNIV